MEVHHDIMPQEACLHCLLEMALHPTFVCMLMQGAHSTQSTLSTKYL